MKKVSRRNMAHSTILHTDGFFNLGITSLTKTKEFKFKSDILLSKFSKAVLRTVLVLKTPPRTTCPVRLGTAIGREHSLMTAGFKSVSTIGNIDHSQLFKQLGLVIPDHQGDVPIMLQNM
jgi:hypothetical protein